MLLKPALNHGLHWRLTHLPQALIPVPERLPTPRRTPTPSASPSPQCLTPSSKSGAKTSHHSLTQTCRQHWQAFVWEPHLTVSIDR
jgi:hypothetical protein